MVKHIILWKIKEEKTEEEKVEIKANVKKGLEGLQGQIPGLVSIHVQTDSLASSTADLMLNSSFESEEALKNYAVHPAHVAVANSAVRPNMEKGRESTNMAFIKNYVGACHSYNF